MNTKPITVLASMLVVLATLSACQKHDETSGTGAGPAQKAGAQLDSAASKAADQLNQAGEKAGQLMQDAGKKLESKSQEAQNQNQQQPQK